MCYIFVFDTQCWLEPCPEDRLPDLPQRFPAYMASFSSILPIELWVEILDYVGSSKYEMNISTVVIFGSFRTVCKAWYNIFWDTFERFDMSGSRRLEHDV